MAGRAVIIEAAINGGTPKSRNPHAPRSVSEIVEDTLACIDSGAAILHNHNDEPVIGTPIHAPEPYLRAWEAVRARVPRAILYPTMGGGAPGVAISDRYHHIEVLAKEGLLRQGLVDPGTTNIGSLGVREPDGRPLRSDAVYLNTFTDVRHMIDCCAAYQLGPSVSIFEPGFLRLALAYHQAGALPRGALIKLYFGGAGAGFGLPPTIPSLNAYLGMLEDTGLPWSVAVLGGDLLATPLAAAAVERGGHLRVGLEDYAGAGTPRNVELVQQAIALVERLGAHAATIDEAADVLGLPR